MSTNLKKYKKFLIILSVLALICIFYIVFNWLKYKHSISRELSSDIVNINTGTDEKNSNNIQNDIYIS